MSTKLITTKDYLLLIDEEAEIRNGDITLYEGDSTINKNFQEDSSGSDCFMRHYNIKVIAYYPLTKEANELDLPLLPNPFEEVSIEKMAIKRYPLENFKEETWLRRNGFIEGYKAAQSKQFSLEDMKKALSEAFKASQEGYQITADEIIQSLSTQQLPISFEPEYDKINDFGEPYTYDDMDFGVEIEYKLKTITNLESKEELVGIYKY